MSLKETLQADIKSAMKSGESATLSVLRMVVSTLKNKEIDKKAKTGDETLSDDEVMNSLLSEVKKRKESALTYRAAGREELAKQEEAEVKILMKYLPAQLSAEEVRSTIAAIATRVGTSSMGILMREVMKELRGKADPNLISAEVKKVTGA